MTYADWLRDELPKVLAGTEHLGSFPIKHRGPDRTVCLDIIGLAIVWFHVDCETGIDFCPPFIKSQHAPIIAEACSLITTIEAKRRELK